MRYLWFPAGTDTSSDDNGIPLHDTDNPGAARCGDCEMEIIRESGFGMPKVEDVTDKAPNQHGETFLFGNLAPREMQLTLRLFGWYEALRAARDVLCGWFNPNDDPTFGEGTLRVVAAMRRDIACRFSGGLNFDIVADDVEELDVELRLIAYDPLFYNAAMTVKTYTLEETGRLRFPARFPIHFGIKTVMARATFQNPGQWLVYPTFVVTGPGQDIKLENRSKNVKIQMVNYSIAAGETVTFSPFPEPTVVSSLRGNVMGYLTPDSDVGSFALGHHPEVKGGENEVYLSVGAVDDRTSAVVSWREAYLTA